MTLNLVNVLDTVSTAAMNPVINTLQQSAGGQEVSHYYVQGTDYTTGAFISNWILSLSKTSTPVSVSIDTSDQSSTGTAAPATGHLVSTGFQVYSGSTGAALSAYLGGKYTLQF